VADKKMTDKKLTTAQVERLRERGRYACGAGLYLQVTSGGSRSWLFRYQRNNKTREMGLGPYPVVTLAAARDLVLDHRRALHAGRDPLEERRAAARALMTSATTFDDVRDEYVEAHKPAWRNPKSAAQWTASLQTYVSPVFGTRQASSITVNDVLAVLTPIWSTKTVTARRIRGRVEVILDYAKARGLREGENPARWRGGLDHLLPAAGKLVKVKHYPALPPDALCGVMRALARMAGVAPMAVRFIVLTAARASEVVGDNRAAGATWDQIDLQRAVWALPAERTKSNREHRVPLSAQALAVLKEAAEIQQDDRVFPGVVRDRPLSLTSLLNALRSAGGGSATIHGLRSTFRDWASEHAHAPRELAEAALAHAVGDATERAYARSDMLERRRELMQRWGSYACGAAALSRRSRTGELRRAS
jgi:integrase